MSKTSRIPGFYKLSPEERLKIVAEFADLTAEEVETLKKFGLKVDESWLRVGGVVGWHFLLSDFGDEMLELHHRVRSRAAFARGALLAAQLIRGRKGLFSFEQILQEFLNA